MNKRLRTKSVSIVEGEVDNLKYIFQAFSFMDHVRWHQKRSKDKSRQNSMHDPEVNLLAHFLVYLTNRGIRVERVWEVGLPVMLSLAKDFMEVGTLAFWNHWGKEERSCLFFEELRYRPRYWKYDLVRIYRVLVVLEEGYGKSLGVLLKDLCCSPPSERSVKRLFSMLVALAYSVGDFKGQILEDNKNYKNKQKSCARKIDKKIKNVVEGGSDEMYIKKRYDSKIIWCVLRDWLMEERMNAFFVETLEKVGVGRDVSEKWRRDSTELKGALKVLELPGDIWNNNKVFWGCIFKKRLSGLYITSVNSSKVTREIYDLIHDGENDDFMPENLDVSFDFVKRMCSERLCDVCPFNSGISDLCHGNEGKICPILLYTCGYKYDCTPDICKLKKLPKLAYPPLE